jgi:hypothetical protein
MKGNACGAAGNRRAFEADLGLQPVLDLQPEIGRRSQYL